MSLCIAAKTFDSCTREVSDGSVVLCYEYRVETPTAQADVGYKTRAISKYLHIMMAGTLPAAVELGDIYESYFKSKTDATPLPLIEQLREPIDIFKKRAAERFTHGHYAVSHEEFMINGLAWFGPQLFRESLFDLKTHIESEEKQVQLLLVGCEENDDELRIFKYSFGELWECDDFAAIGSGETIAESVLYRRGLTQLATVAETAYSVYEAKCMAEITPGVGIATSMSIMEVEEDGLRWRFVSADGFRYLGKAFLEKYGPRPYEHEPLPVGFLNGGFGEWGDLANQEDQQVPESTTHAD